MEQMTRVVLALDAPEVLVEIMHFLDRSGVIRVVATAGDDRQLTEATRQLEPDVVIAEPALASGMARGVPVLAITTRESVSALRAAINAGVRGFVVWPSERDELLTLVQGFATTRRVPERRATVVGVHAARGGAGCTFVATHLAQAFALSGRTCVLIDGDLAGGDVAPAVGIADDAEGVHSLTDLAGVIQELTPAQLVEALWVHPSGFSVLPAPADPSAGGDADVLRAAVALAAGVVDVVVLHLAGVLDPATRWALSASDRIVEVLSLDVLSFRASTRALASVGPDDLTARLAFVVNRAARSEIVPSDVQRTFGQAPLAVIPSDGSVPRLQDHGRLLAARSRTGRAIARLAERLLDPGDQHRSVA